MRAARISRFGPSKVLDVVDVEDPSAGDGVTVVRVVAASINPSDVKNLAGAMTQTTLPRVPGRDYAGVVENGPAEWVGARVWGSGGDLGFNRDGSHAERLIVPAASLNHLPDALGFEAAACVGVNFVTAWCALTDAANLREGETLLVIGAGGVGTAAAQIARLTGAVAIVANRSAPPKDAVIRGATERFLVGAPDLAAALHRHNGGRGADVVLDTVGGPLFRTALGCLARGGRLVEISTSGQREVSFDLADFYHNESRLVGVDSLSRDAVAAGRILARLCPGFEAGDYKPMPVAAAMALERAREAYGMVEAGIAGKVVLQPQS